MQVQHCAEHMLYTHFRLLWACVLSVSSYLGPFMMQRCWLPRVKHIAHQLAGNAPDQHQVVQVQDTQVVIQFLLHSLQALILLEGISRASESSLA